MLTEPSGHRPSRRERRAAWFEANRRLRQVPLPARLKWPAAITFSAAMTVYAASFRWDALDLASPLLAMAASFPLAAAAKYRMKHVEKEQVSP